ncbi:hypothetical protein DPX16_14699 [Anabarilius grahami]|uniref:Uncharacterized protein n=1 Tax=Anabarilius grahami TaxID=495550 RepID=A0A3N0XNZ6_ANAGA|nr:hypothetical protein DPX16_14699 [Anabarilius grahami]
MWQDHDQDGPSRQDSHGVDESRGAPGGVQGHQGGTDPSAKLKNNVATKIFRIKHFIGYMAAGN